MANSIRIGGGGSGSATLITKTITQNGTYSAQDDNADGYSEVTVDVEGGAEYVDISTFAYHFKRNTTTPTVTKKSDYEYSLSFQDQNASGYELCAFSVSLEKGVYVAEIKATVNKNTGLANQYPWGIYSATTTSGEQENSADVKNKGYTTYVPFDKTDTNEHYYEVPVNVTADGTAYICFAMADDNGVNATITVRSLKIRKAYGSSIPTLKLNEGKIALTTGEIVADSDYYYTDEFDMPSGYIMFDMNLNSNQTYDGLVIYDDGGNYNNYWNPNARFRVVNMSSYYHAGYKCRLSFRKSNIDYVMLRDYNANILYTSNAPVSITE